MTTDVAEPTQAEAEATQAEPTQSDEQEADALLADLTAGAGTEAEPDNGTEGEATVDDEEQAAIDARAAELAEKKAQELAQAQEAKRKADEEKAKRKAEEEGITAAFRGRAQAIREFGRDQGWEPDAIERIVATFEAHHAQSSPVALRQMQQELVAAAGLEEYEWENPQSFIEAVREAAKSTATEGLLTETQHNRKVADALLAQKRRFQKNPELLTAATNGARDIRGGAGASGKFYSQMTAEERGRMSPAEIDAAVAREAAFRARQGA